MPLTVTILLNSSFAVGVAVSVKVLVLLVLLLGLNDAVTPLGRPETAKITLPVKLPMSATEIVPATVLPWLTVKLTGAYSEKSLRMIWNTVPQPYSPPSCVTP